MFRIHNYLIYFPPNVLTPSHFPTFFSHSYDPLNYVIPFCTHTRYIPSSIKLWSLSHVDFKNCTSLRSFKFLLHCSANSFVLVHIYLYFLSQLANNCYRENNYCVSKKAHKFLVFSGTKLFASVVISSSEVGFQKQFLTFFALFLAGGWKSSRSGLNLESGTVMMRPRDNVCVVEKRLMSLVANYVIHVAMIQELAYIGIYHEYMKQ